MSRNLEICYKCSIEAIKNTTLCQLHKVSKGSNTDQFSESQKSLRKLTRPSSLVVSKVANCPYLFGEYKCILHEVHKRRLFTDIVE